MTFDVWRVTFDVWHVTCDLWRVTRDVLHDRLEHAADSKNTKQIDL